MKARINMQRCRKCWAYGHRLSDCTGTDRSRLCFACGEEDHQKESTTEPNCPICQRKGHETGSGNCDAFQTLLTTAKKGAQNSDTCREGRRLAPQLQNKLSSVAFEGLLVKYLLGNGNGNVLSCGAKGDVFINVSKDLKVKGEYKGTGYVGIELEKLIMFSVYFSLNGDNEDFEKLLNDLEHPQSNRHEQIKTNRRGTLLEDWMSANDLVAVNRGSTPTLSGSRGEFLIDVTIATIPVAEKIKNWQVLTAEENMSDHHSITFNYGSGPSPWNSKAQAANTQRWTANPKTVAKFTKTLAQLVQQHPNVDATVCDAILKKKSPTGKKPPKGESPHRHSKSSPHCYYYYYPITNIRFLIDSGSDVSLIPKRIGDCSQLSKFTLFAANNTTIRTYADTDHAIIGADFISNFKLIIDLSKNRVVDPEMHITVLGKSSVSATSSIHTLSQNYHLTVHGPCPKCPLHMVPKKSGAWGPVGGYGRLNSVAIEDKYPVPNLHDFSHFLEALAAFDQCKSDVSTATLLVHPSSSAPVSLTAGASNFAMGAVGSGKPQVNQDELAQNPEDDPSYSDSPKHPLTTKQASPKLTQTPPPKPATNANLNPQLIQLLLLSDKEIEAKVTRLAALISQNRENDVDIALIQETFLKPNTHFYINNYAIYRTDRLTKGGGTAIIIKKSIAHKQIPPFNSVIENTAIKLEMCNTSCAEGHFYLECKKPRDIPAKCINCNGSHPASYFACPKNPNFIAQTQVKQKLASFQNKQASFQNKVDSTISFAAKVAQTPSPKPSAPRVQQAPASSPGHQSANLNPALIQLLLCLNAKFRFEFEGYLRKNDVDIAFLQETFLQPQTQYRLNNYKIYRNDCPNNKGGGIVIVIKSSLAHSQTPPTTNTVIEHTSIILNMENSQIRIISAYKPPRVQTSQQDYYSLLDNSLPTLLAGDLNSKHVSLGCRKSNAEGRKLLKYSQDLNFEIFAPSEPTHFDHRTPDILDIALAKDISHTITLTNSDSLSSDHNPINININEQYACNPLDHFPHNAKDLNILTKTLTKTITAAVSKATTLKTNKNQNPFSLPPEIKSRNKLKRRAKQFADSVLNKQANKISKLIKIQINSLKNEKWSEFLENIPTGDADAWKVSKALRGTTKTFFPPIHGESGLVYTDEEKAEAFADFLEHQFSPNMSQTYDLDFEEEVENILQEIKHRQTPPNPRPYPPLTLPELKAQITALKTRKSPGPDQISNKTLNLLPENLNLTLINASFTLRTFPTLWKTASIILIPKPSKNKTFPQNWRPISLLSSLSQNHRKTVPKPPP
ncbi:hypothetical protein HUJ05_002594 [Dendroctonus ponderosae]|nr:hypothetical protein HUJ05_002594 [Dendroctonus ponderosae]